MCCVLIVRPCCSLHIRVWRFFHLKLCSIMDTSCRIFFSQAWRQVHVLKGNGGLLKSRMKATNPCGIKSTGELAAWHKRDFQSLILERHDEVHVVLSVDSCSSSRHNFCPEYWHVSSCVLSWLYTSVIHTIFPHIRFTLSEVSTDTAV